MSGGYHMEDEVQRRAYDSAIMRRLLVYIRPYRKLMLVALVFLIGASAISSVSPLLLMWGIDQVVKNPERSALEVEAASGDASPILVTEIADYVSQDKHHLFFLVSVLASFIVIELVLRYVQVLIVAIVGQRTMFEMRLGLFRHLQRMSLSFLDRNPVGRLMSRVTNDVEKIQQTVVSGVVQVASDLLTIVIVLGLMFWVNWELTLLAISPVPFIFLVSLIFRKYAHHSFLEIRKKIARLNANMQENISGMRIVQIFGRERDNFETYRKLNADHRDEWLRQVRNFAVYFPAVEFLSSLSTAILILYCSIQVIKIGGYETGGASVGSLFAYTAWSERLFGPIRALADRYNMLLEAMASSERVFQLLDTEAEVVDKPEPVTPERLRGEVIFDDVYFRYDEGPWILKGIDLKVAPGERVAIVGHTGAGKTTITSLLSRFYDIQQGAIRVDGVDVRDYAQVELRHRIGVVLQDVFLFADSISENIRLGDDRLTDEAIRTAAGHVNAAPFIERLPGRYEYRVGERGCNLSTGQRQLVAFARALAHDPDILVLDEATSSIDTETEGLIQDAIDSLLEGKDGHRRTCIVIAHRLSTIQHCDRIVVMHHGEIREVGTHQELLAQDGLYRTLYELQYKDQLTT